MLASNGLMDKRFVCLVRRSVTISSSNASGHYRNAPIGSRGIASPH